ncbi:Mom family adenine methylcarbamoylation protein [Nocardia asiatica]|uniref:Mom family adenine methylcarbamoylation protein n=1 Tax=Nocardia asiatica TaxID=209252 RepID=UPI000315E3BB|nr:hypothetical protein [Nocardia asiatica]
MTTPPPVRYSQRWRSRLCSPATTGRFDPHRYGVDFLETGAARRFITAHHYTRTFPQVRYSLGMWDLSAPDTPRLVGVLTLSNGSNVLTLTNAFPGLVPYEQSLVLSRLILDDSVPANGESWFTAQSLRLAADEGLRGVVAFSDPSEYWQVRNGRRERVKRGHHGGVYQASNFQFAGQTKASWKLYFPDGPELSRRAISKITGGEVGHGGVVARLIAYGAPPLTEGTDPRAWFEVAKAAAGLERRKHPGNYTYTLRTGRTRAQRTRTRIALPSLPYPKPQLILPGLDTTLP